MDDIWYRFEIDGRAASPYFDNWEDAAREAVSKGYATWLGPGSVALEDTQGAEIKRYKKIQR